MFGRARGFARARSPWADRAAREAEREKRRRGARADRGLGDNRREARAGSGGEAPAPFLGAPTGSPLGDPTRRGKKRGNGHAGLGRETLPGLREKAPEACFGKAPEARFGDESRDS
jgi:hypothetical protein